MSLKRWPKIFQVGEGYTSHLCDDPVSITEKIDGSQFNFGMVADQGLVMLSKGAHIHVQHTSNLFKPAVEYVQSIECRLPRGWSFHAETLWKPKHNILTYDRVPKGHLALYGVTNDRGEQVQTHQELAHWADLLGIDVVPELFYGNINPACIMDVIRPLLEKQSFLGKETIEGVVIKNYKKAVEIGGLIYPLCQAKFVSEKFKERHLADWPTNNKSPLMVLKESIRSEARWHKALQRVAESNEGNHVFSVKDIGPCIKLVLEDLVTEDKEYIKESLYNAYIRELKGAAIAGLPEWMKEQLANGTLNSKIA